MTAKGSPRVVVIVNGAAGGGRAKRLAGEALGTLRSRGLELVVRETLGPGHGTAIAREAHARGERRFVAAGGDGTSFEVLNGLFPREVDDPVELGVLPLGTGNSFPRDFALQRPKQAIDAIADGGTLDVDVLRLVHTKGTLHFINLLGLGFVARVGALTNARFKPLGALGYVAAVVACTLRQVHARTPLRLDDATGVDDRPSFFLCFCNSRYTGGAMKMAPDADPRDGLVDVIRAAPLKRLEVFRQLPRIFTGTHVRDPRVEVARASRVHFASAPPQACLIDGEIRHLELVSLTVLQGALRLLVGANGPARGRWPTVATS